MKSMTGFGKAAGTLPDGTEVSVVVKGVNHRFLDLGIKLRDEYASAEPAIRRAVGRVAQRGHIDVLIRTTKPAGAAATARIDMDAAEKYAREWRGDSSNRRLPGELTARDLLGLPGVVRQEEAAPGEGTFEEVFLSRRTGAPGFRRRAGARGCGSSFDLRRNPQKD